jgi:hypothetical protein
VSRIVVIHENEEWIVPLRRALAERDVPLEEWYIDSWRVDLGAVPPEGVFYSRMSASSYMRDHRFSPDMASITLSWLERHGRRVINGAGVLALEVSKMAQYAALDAHGILTPRTVAAMGADSVVEAARAFAPAPVILKPNRGGKGDGVQLFLTVDALSEFIHGGDYEEPVDGIWVLQEYVKAAKPFITRCEFIGGKLFYAVRVDTSQGFDLCPADVCQIGDAFCPAGEDAPAKFTIVDTVDRGLIEKYETFLAANHIEVAGIEFIVDEAGQVFTYDINTNTNYNSDAEARAGKSAMNQVARFLETELARVADPRQGELRLTG